jgi:phosphocarrier protein
MSDARAGEKSSPFNVAKVFVLKNKLGMHARPSAMFVKAASRFISEIYVEKDGEKVNGKSIMGLMMLAAACGTKLKIIAQGEDAAQAIQTLEDLILRGFDED